MNNVYITEIQNSRIQMVKYKSLEYNPFKYIPFKYIPFKYIPFKKHPPKLGVSYSIMSGRWFGGGANGLRRPGCSKDEKTDIISIIWCDGVEMVGVMVCRR